MDFPRIYSEPEVYDNLLTSFRNQEDMAMSSMVMNRSFNVDDDYDNLGSYYDARRACRYLEDADNALARIATALSNLSKITEGYEQVTPSRYLSYALNDLDTALVLSEDQEVRKCIMSMLKDAYLWTSSIYRLLSTTLDTCYRQEAVRNAELYMEKANSLYL